MYREYHFEPDEVLEYLRKSRSDDPDMSVEEVLAKHERILNAYAERELGGVIPEENTFREVASSETIDGRPEMLRLLSLIEDPRYKAVLVVEVQRLSRGDLEDAGRLIKLLRFTDTKVITPGKVYDLSDEYDRDAFERELKRGNEYLEYFKRIQARGRLESVREGNYIGNVAPYGYDKTVVTMGKKKCHTLVPNADADIVRLIFELYAKGMGKPSICKYLEDMKIPSPSGRRNWSPACMRDMLSNEHYIGKVRWNWRRTVTVVKDQNVIHTRPKSHNYLVCEGRHEAIISDELWAQVQERLANNPRVKSAVRVRNPFAGLVYCRCGRAMSLRTYKRPDGSERSPARLLCDDQVHCSSGSVTYTEFLQRICDVLEEYISDFEIHVKRPEDDTAKIHANIVKNLTARLEVLEKKEMNMWEKYTDEGMPAEIFHKLNDKLVSEKAELTSAIEAAKANMPEEIDYEERIERFSAALSALRNPDADAEQKNILLRAVFERITYTRERPVRGAFEKRADGKMSPRWISPDFTLDIQLRI